MTTEFDPSTCSDDPLTDRVQILQRRAGHRYSLDDVLTAREALRARPAPERYADIGCGIGSVLLSVIDRADPRSLRAAAGIEAQVISYQMVCENTRRNTLPLEPQLLHGDLRDPATRARLHETTYDLITGTPPYAPPGSATPSPDSQRAHARIEYRGGVEAYIEAASAMLAEDGTFVLCATDIARTHEAAAQAGLFIRRQVAAIPRAGRSALFHVFVMGRGTEGETEHVEFIARDESGARTDAYIALRRFFGLPRSAEPCTPAPS